MTPPFLLPRHAGVLVLWAGSRFAPYSIGLPRDLSSAFSGCFISLRWPNDVRLGQTSTALMRAVPYFLPTFAPVFRIHLKEYQDMFRQLAIIIGCLAVGEFIVWLTGVCIPSSILGMLLLTALLKVGIVKLEWVETTSNFLVKNMGFFFVPPGVALMLYFDIIRAELLPIVVATVLSTMLVLVTTGWVHVLTRKAIARARKRTEKSEEPNEEED